MKHHIVLADLGWQRCCHTSDQIAEIKIHFIRVSDEGTNQDHCSNQTLHITWQNNFSECYPPIRIAISNRTASKVVLFQ